MMTSWFIKAILEFSSGKNITIDRNTTLNEKFDVLPNERPPAGAFPYINYFGLGIGGIGEGVTTAFHLSIDAALFEHIPYICREISNDLNSIERMKYRLRVVTRVNNIDYAFYYLKAFDSNNDEVTIKQLTKTSGRGGIIADIDTNVPTILSPIPRSTEEVDLTKSEFYIVDNRINFSLTYEDKLEIINAYKILTGNSAVPPITELGIFFGSDVQTDNGGVEAVAVRPAYFYAIPYELQSMLTKDDVTQRYLDLGGMRLR